MLKKQEMKVLVEGIAQNDLNYGNPLKGVPIDSIEDIVEIKGNVYNVVNDLKKSGYVGHDNDYVWLTNMGFKFYKNHNQVTA